MDVKQMWKTKSWMERKSSVILGAKSRPLVPTMGICNDFLNLKLEKSQCCWQQPVDDKASGCPQVAGVGIADFCKGLKGLEGSGKGGWSKRTLVCGARKFRRERGKP